MKNKTNQEYRTFNSSSDFNFARFGKKSAWFSAQHLLAWETQFFSVDSISSQSERPEEEYDSRTLYERLKVQRDRKQEEWEEQFKFSESVKRTIMNSHEPHLFIKSKKFEKLA